MLKVVLGYDAWNIETANAYLKAFSTPPPTDGFYTSLPFVTSGGTSLLAVNLSLSAKAANNTAIFAITSVVDPVLQPQSYSCPSQSWFQSLLNNYTCFTTGFVSIQFVLSLLLLCITYYEPCMIIVTILVQIYSLHLLQARIVSIFFLFFF